MIDDLILSKEIGHGTFGKVFVAFKKGENNKKYAVKQIAKSMALQPQYKKYLDNELNILKEVDHPNIIKLIEIKHTVSYFYIVTELCDMGLSKCLETYTNKKFRPFPQTYVQHLMRQITSGIQYLHNNKILHRDLKLDNILVKFDSEEDKNEINLLNAQVKIIDFGFARHLENELAASKLGSPLNMAPQILEKLWKVNNDNSWGYDEKVDIWSLGTLCYEMLVGYSPFDSSSKEELIQKIETGDYKIPQNTKLSKECISFLNCMLQYDPKKRLGINEICRHWFLTRNVNDFTEINLKKVVNKNNAIILNTKQDKLSQSVWCMFDAEKNLGEEEESINLTDIKLEDMIEQKNEDGKEKRAGITIKDEDILGKLHDSMFNDKYAKDKESNVVKVGGRRESDVIYTGCDEEESSEIAYKEENKIQLPNANSYKPGKGGEILYKVEKAGANLVDFYMRAFDKINSDFAYVEPMPVPFILDEYPDLKGETSEFSENII